MRREAIKTRCRAPSRNASLRCARELRWVWGGLREEEEEKKTSNWIHRWWKKSNYNFFFFVDKKYFIIVVINMIIMWRKFWWRISLYLRHVSLRIKAMLIEKCEGVGGGWLVGGIEFENEKKKNLNLIWQ